MRARIYKPARNDMSSGQARTREWVLEFESEVPRRIEPLMGYTSSAETQTKVRLTFPTREDAVAYAERHGIAYMTFEPKGSKRQTISYSDNFRRDRLQPWSH